MPAGKRIGVPRASTAPAEGLGAELDALVFTITVATQAIEFSRAVEHGQTMAVVFKNLEAATAGE